MAEKKKNVVARETSAVIQPTQTNQRIEKVVNSLEGKGRLILYVIGGIVGLMILASILYAWQNRTASAAQAALGKAIEINGAQVSASPIPNNPALTFSTEKERTDKAIAAFEEVARKYGSPYREKAQYFIALNRLKIDRGAGLTELENLTKNGNGEVAALSKFALAEAKAAEGKYDEAVALYGDLTKQNNSVLPTETLNFELAEVYEKQGKTAEAADIYFNLAKNAREAKDADGKPATIGLTARQAAQKLEKLDAAKFQQLPPEPSAVNL